MDVSPAVDRDCPTFDIFVTALRDTHAVEQQALQLMERQVERMTDYPEMIAALRTTSRRPTSSAAVSRRRCRCTTRARPP